MRGTAVALVVVIALAVVAGSGAPAVAVQEADRLWLVGEQSFQDGLTALSRRVLERFVERFPDDRRIPAATLLLGKARLAQGALPQALESFRKAQTFAPAPGRPEEARFWEAETLFRMKRFAEARTLYDRVVAENAASPMAPDALYGLAWAQVELKQREAAVTAFRQLVEAFPDHATVPGATVSLGRLLIELKRHGEAERLLAPFLERYPDHKLVPEARYLRGLALVSAGRADDGVAELRALVAAYPSHEFAAQARRAIADTLVRDGKKTALADEYKELMAQSPRTPEALYDAGAIATRLGRGRDAEQAFLALRTEFPDHALAGRASLELGHAAFGRGAYKDSVTLARAAARSPEEPTRAQAFLLAGEGELRLKRFKPAQEAFASAVELAGKDAGVRYRALAGNGLAFEEQKQWAPAAKLYDEVAADCPDKELRQWAKTRRAAIAPNLKQPPAKKSPPASKGKGGQ